MTLNQLIKEICLREGKLKQVSVGNVREVFGILSDIVYEELTDCDNETARSESLDLLFESGQKRFLKRNKPVKKKRKKSKK